LCPCDALASQLGDSVRPVPWRKPFHLGVQLIDPTDPQKRGEPDHSVLEYRVTRNADGIGLKSSSLDFEVRRDFESSFGFGLDLVERHPVGEFNEGHARAARFVDLENR
jgi:hypothetical protein